MQTAQKVSQKVQMCTLSCGAQVPAPTSLCIMNSLHSLLTLVMPHITGYRTLLPTTGYLRQGKWRPIAGQQTGKRAAMVSFTVVQERVSRGIVPWVEVNKRSLYALH